MWPWESSSPSEPLSEPCLGPEPSLCHRAGRGSESASHLAKPSLWLQIFISTAKLGTGWESREGLGTSKQRIPLPVPSLCHPGRKAFLLPSSGSCEAGRRQHVGTGLSHRVPNTKDRPDTVLALQGLPSVRTPVSWPSTTDQRGRWSWSLRPDGVQEPLSHGLASSSSALKWTAALCGAGAATPGSGQVPKSLTGCPVQG